MQFGDDPFLNWSFEVERENHPTVAKNAKIDSQ